MAEELAVATPIAAISAADLVVVGAEMGEGTVGGSVAGLPEMGTVATVEHGVPLMRSKWVQHQWAHQGGEQGKDSRPADGPPSAPRQPDKDGVDNHD